MHKFSKLSLSLFISTITLWTQPLFAETRRDKSEVIEDISNKLFESFQNRVTGKVVLIPPPKTNTVDFTNEDCKLVRSRFITKIQSNGYIVLEEDLEQIKAIEAYQGSGAVNDKQVQKMGNKAGAQLIISLSFAEIVGRYDGTDSDVTVTVDLRTIDIKTGKIVIARTVDTKYEHILYKESYIARDSTIFALGFAKWTSLVGSVYFLVQGSNESEKANLNRKKSEKVGTPAAEKAEFVAQEEKYRKLAKENYMYSGGLFGGMIVSWIFQNHFEKLPRDTTDLTFRKIFPLQT